MRGAMIDFSAPFLENFVMKNLRNEERKNGIKK